MSAEMDRHGRLAVTVDDYLAAVPDEARAALQDLRATIRAAAPEAEEGDQLPGSDIQVPRAAGPFRRVQGPLQFYRGERIGCRAV